MYISIRAHSSKQYLEGREALGCLRLDVLDGRRLVIHRLRQHHRRRDHLPILLIGRAKRHSLRHQRVSQKRTVHLLVCAKGICQAPGRSAKIRHTMHTGMRVLNTASRFPNQGFSI